MSKDKQITINGRQYEVKDNILDVGPAQLTFADIQGIVKRSDVKQIKSTFKHNIENISKMLTECAKSRTIEGLELGCGALLVLNKADKLAINAIKHTLYDNPRFKLKYDNMSNTVESYMGCSARARYESGRKFTIMALVIGVPLGVGIASTAIVLAAFSAAVLGALYSIDYKIALFNLTREEKSLKAMP